MFFMLARISFVPPSSQPLEVRIPAHTRRQAMDWSLVLASQGIEHAIDHDEAAGWILSVTAADHDLALAQIRQYRLENRHWRWRRPIFQPGLFFDWSCVGWVGLTLIFYGWSESRSGLRSLGMMDVGAVSQGQWWRLFTATLLHADLTHLALNAVFGFLFLGLALGRYGPGVGLLASYLAGAGGNVSDWLVYDAGQRGLGASGVVMGALGLITFPSLAQIKSRHSNAFRLVIGGLVGGALLFLFVGTSPEADVVAHLGGFISGWLLGLLLAFAPRFVPGPRINLAAGILFVVLVLLPWWLALTSPAL